jgi:TetR/AcrR family transcriptional regulator, cholesterol catabolism regulator
VRRQYADYWDRLFAQAQAAGELRPDVSVGVMRLFVLGSLNFTVEWYNPKLSSFESFSRHISRLVFDGILDRGGQNRRPLGRPRRAAQAH